MLIKLECNYAINPDRITLEHRGDTTVAHVDGLVLPLTNVELALIQAYHDERNVGATLEEIKKQMEEAKRKVEIEERHNKSDALFRAYCKRCLHGPEMCPAGTICEMRLDWDQPGTEISVVHAPTRFAPILASENEAVEFSKERIEPECSGGQLHDDVSCANCKFRYNPRDSMACRPCVDFSNHIPADDI